MTDAFIRPSQVDLNTRRMAEAPALLAASQRGPTGPTAEATAPDAQPGLDLAGSILGQRGDPVAECGL